MGMALGISWKSLNGSQFGFEAMLWVTIDKLRGNLDAVGFRTFDMLQPKLLLYEICLIKEPLAIFPRPTPKETKL